MALTLMSRRDPFAEFDTMIRRAFPTVTGAGRAVDSRGAGRNGTPLAFRPAVDIVRDGNDALISLDIPGVDFESDIEVEVDGATLTISGERRDVTTAKDNGENGTRTLREVRYGSFRRAFTLPEHVGPEQLSASYDAGVLTVRVSGAYVGSEPRKIAVRAGSTASGSTPQSLGESSDAPSVAVIDAATDADTADATA